MQEYKVICNGIPKSGTHCLVRCIELLGMTTEHIHANYSQKPNSKQKHIFIYRHPKNVIISWLRFTSEVNEGFIMCAIKDFEGEGVYQTYKNYEKYLNDSSVLCIKFEDLISDKGISLQKIADYLDVNIPDGAYDRIIGLTRTYTGKLSNWEEHWTEDIEKVWQEYKCEEILKKWNY